MKTSYSFFEKFIVRTPALSGNALTEISSDTIKELCHSPLVSEAIYLASPELHVEMQKYLKSDSPKNTKLEVTLLKYLLRMSHRCTPFGLFAGISVGKLGNTTKLTLNDVSKYKRKTRLDMNYLCSLVQELEKVPEIKNQLEYYPNTSLYMLGNRYRYVEFRYRNSIRHHYMVSIDVSQYIDKVIHLSQKGARIHELVQAIVSLNKDLDPKDAKNFIHDLIENQILISSISPTVSGDDYLEYVGERTNITWLKELKTIVNQLDEKVFHNELSHYYKICQALKQMAVPFNKKFLFQTDLIATTASNELDKSIVDDLGKAVAVLNKLTTRIKNPRLESFKQAFSNRYEEEEVPLSLVLDVESGIGYNQSYTGSYDVCPLVDDLIISSHGHSGGDAPFYRYDLRQADRLIYNKFLEAKEKKLFEIEFTDHDLEGLPENWNDLPTTFPLICSVFKAKDQSIISMSDVGGPSASYLLGRFSHTSEEIRELLNEIVAKEKRENVILAEVVHLPEARTGNILYRTNLREYEIPYLAKSNLPSAYQIPISDLHISIKNERLVLRSKRLNMYIEPRMGNAHNYEDNSLPIYNFLGDMQAQSLCDSLEFSWGPALNEETFFPRVRYKNVILSAAKWRIPRSDFEGIQNQNDIQKLIKKYSLPSVFLLTDYDNELKVNLENELSCRMFLSEIKKKQIVTIKECLTNEFQSIVTNGKNSFSNEFLFSLYKQN